MPLTRDDIIELNRRLNVVLQYLRNTKRKDVRPSMASPLRVENPMRFITDDVRDFLDHIKKDEHERDQQARLAELIEIFIRENPKSVPESAEGDEEVPLPDRQQCIHFKTAIRELRSSDTEPPTINPATAAALNIPDTSSYRAKPPSMRPLELLGEEERDKEAAAPEQAHSPGALCHAIYQSSLCDHWTKRTGWLALVLAALGTGGYFLTSHLLETESGPGAADVGNDRFPFGFVNGSYSFTDHDRAIPLPDTTHSSEMPPGMQFIISGPAVLDPASIDAAVFAVEYEEEARGNLTTLTVKEDTPELVAKAAWSTLLLNMRSNLVPPGPSAPFLGRLDGEVSIMARTPSGTELAEAQYGVSVINTSPAWQLPTETIVDVMPDTTLFPAARALTTLQANTAASDLNLGQGDRLVIHMATSDSAYFDPDNLFAYAAVNATAVGRFTITSAGEIDPSSLSGAFTGNIAAAEAFLANHGYEAERTGDDDFAYEVTGHFIQGLALIEVDATGAVIRQHGFASNAEAHRLLNDYGIVSPGAGIYLHGSNTQLGQAIRQAGMIHAKPSLGALGSEHEIGSHMVLFDRLGASIEADTDRHTVSVTAADITAPTIATETLTITSESQPFWTLVDGMRGSGFDSVTLDIPIDRNNTITNNGEDYLLSTTTLLDFPGLAALDGSSDPVASSMHVDTEGNWLRLTGTINDIDNLLNSAEGGVTALEYAGRTGENHYTLAAMRLSYIDGTLAHIIDGDGNPIIPDAPGMIPGRKIIQETAANHFSFNGETAPGGHVDVLSGRRIAPYAATSIALDDALLNAGDEIFARIEILDPINTGYPNLIASGWAIKTIDGTTYIESPAATNKAELADLNIQVQAAELALGIGPDGTYYGPAATKLDPLNLSGTLTYWRNNEEEAFSPALSGVTVVPEIPTPLTASIVSAITNQNGDSESKAVIADVAIDGPDALSYNATVTVASHYLGSAVYTGGSLASAHSWSFTGNRTAVQSWLSDTFGLLPEPNQFDPQATPPGNGQSIALSVRLTSEDDSVPPWTVSDTIRINEYNDPTSALTRLATSAIAGTESNIISATGYQFGDADIFHQQFVLVFHLGDVNPPVYECTEPFPGAPFKICDGGTNGAFTFSPATDAWGNRFILDPNTEPKVEGSQWTDRHFYFNNDSYSLPATMWEITSTAANFTLAAVDDGNAHAGQSVEAWWTITDRVSGSTLATTNRTRITNNDPTRRLRGLSTPIWDSWSASDDAYGGDIYSLD